MAVKRPWVLPNDVKSYTSHKEVSERSDEKLTFDIARAEMKIIHITNNKFAEYDEIPEPVKMAVILVAEASVLIALIWKNYWLITSLQMESEKQ